MKDELIKEAIRLLQDPTAMNISFAIVYLSTVKELSRMELRELEDEARKHNAQTCINKTQS